MAEITKEKIEELVKLEEELDKVKKEASSKLKSAKSNKKQTHELERDGEKVEISESDLWDEVFRLGIKCQAGEILQEKYPEVFEAYEKQKEKSKEVDSFFVDKFGFPFAEITPSRLIKLVEAIIEYKND